MVVYRWVCECMFQGGGAFDIYKCGRGSVQVCVTSDKSLGRIVCVCVCMCVCVREGGLASEVPSTFPRCIPASGLQAHTWLAELQVFLLATPNTHTNTHTDHTNTHLHSHTHTYTHTNSLFPPLPPMVSYVAHTPCVQDGRQGTARSRTRAAPAHCRQETKGGTVSLRECALLERPARSGTRAAFACSR
jgi:hypothetical protein